MKSSTDWLKSKLNLNPSARTFTGAGFLGVSIPLQTNTQTNINNEHSTSIHTAQELLPIEPRQANGASRLLQSGQFDDQLGKPTKHRR